MSDRKTAAQRLIQRRGMTAAKLDEVHRQNEELPWTVRCWSCKKNNTGKPRDLQVCEHCGVNLRSRT